MSFLGSVKRVVRRVGAGAPQRATPLAIDSKIMFHHVPKCGGTSLNAAIRASFGGRVSEGVGAHHVDPVASKRAAGLLDRRLQEVRQELLLYTLAMPGARFVTGHVGFSELAYETFSPAWDFISMLREPTAKWTSQYFFNRHKKDDHFRIDQPLEAFLESGEAAWLGHSMVSFFAGEMPEAGPHSKQALDQATRNIDRLALVGVLEHLDRFQAAYEKRFGAPLIVEQRNRNPVSTGDQREAVTPTIRRRIEELCAPDLALYEYVLQNHVRA